MTTTQGKGADLPVEVQNVVTIRFAGDSGDGMQMTGNQFTISSANVGNDLATLPDFPAEIRAPAGTRAGVSGFQLSFSSRDIFTPGDQPDVLVAMNPAALAVNIKELRIGGIVIVNTGAFTEKELKRAKLDTNPLEDGSLAGYRVIEVDISARVKDALVGSPLSPKDVQRCKNFYTLGLLYWLYSRPIEPTIEWLGEKFGKKRPELAEANVKALRAGYNSGEIRQLFEARFVVPKCDELAPGTYRNINGNEATGLGLIAGAKLAGLLPVLGSYPITPATTILEAMAACKNHGVITMQVEDEIAGICCAIGASFAGKLGMTTTSGPGLALKTEALGLAMMAELPLVVVNVQRGGPSTGLPTKTEQADLLQAVMGRNGDTPIPVLAIATVADAFDCAIEACRIATQYMTPVILLSDGYIANGSEPWKLPKLEDLPKFEKEFLSDPEGFMPYGRDDRNVRPWVKPGTLGMQHRIGSLEKAHLTGDVSYDPDNHQFMTQIRHDKVNGIRETTPTPEVDTQGEARLLVLGWGSSYGPITNAVAQARADGQVLDRLHMRHIWPMPKGLDEIFSRYERILIPEMNMGQMTRLLRSEFPKHEYVSYSKVKGQPLLGSEIAEQIRLVLEN